tara:strand:+ start:2056 stop:2316 length:261 start_codon:yes stop_codon:yes gene_type:complete
MFAQVYRKKPPIKRLAMTAVNQIVSNAMIINSFLFILFIVSRGRKLYKSGDNWIRTSDICLAKAALYQLSYIPIVEPLRGLEPPTG